MLVDTFVQRGQTHYVYLSNNDVNKLYLYISQLNINPSIFWNINIVKLWTLHVVHLSKLCCYSNRWLWVRLNFGDVLKMERYHLFNLFLFLGQKLTIVEQSCTVQGHFSLTSCHVLTAKYAKYLLSYSAFFWHILLYKYSTQYVSWNNNHVFFDNCSTLINDFKKIRDVACLFQLNTTWKGKLINPIESNSQMRSTFVWIHLQSYHCLVY